MKLWVLNRRDLNFRICSTPLQGDGLQYFSSWALPETQETPAAILGKFREQLEHAENFQTAQLKLMAPTLSGPHESLSDFVNRCKLQVLKCAFTPVETDMRLLELITVSTRDSAFQRNLLSKDKGFTLEDALKLGN